MMSSLFPQYQAQWCRNGQLELFASEQPIRSFCNTQHFRAFIMRLWMVLGAG